MKRLLPIELSVRDRERVRQRSKALLGNRYRLEIAAAVAGLETELFHAKELAEGLGIPHNVVSEQAKAFVAAGVCADVPPVEGQRFRYFQRLPSSYWEACRSMVAEI
jgi:hypothetical protein